MRKPRWLKPLFYLSYFKLKPLVRKLPLRWKDKFGTPRCESIPMIRIEWLWFGMVIQKGGDVHYQDCEQSYWEQWLWIHKYCDGDEKQAELLWPWSNEKGETTWINYD